MSVHGTARFATRDELSARGYLAEWTPGEAPDGLLVGWWLENRYDFAPITYKGDLHQLIVGGIGSGKFTTALAPLLIGSGLDGQSVVVIDPKGEIASLAGKLFQVPFADRPNVHLLDPWNECGTGKTASLSFLDLLNADNPNLVDDARALADAIVIPSGNQNTHWDNAARNFAAALMLYVALDPSEENKTLLRIRDLITRPWSIPKTIGDKKPESLSGLLYSNVESPLADGAVRRGFTALLNRDEKERAGVISSLERDTAWLDSPNMKKVLSGENSIDLKEAALGGGKYFVVLPAEYFTTHRGWLRLCVAAFASAFKRHKPKSDRPLYRRWRHIVIDEFPSLGEMNSVLTDIAVSRGYEVKYHFAVQDLPQLRRIYGDGWESFVNNAFLRVFGLNDLFSAEYVSRLLGSATVQSRSVSTSSSQTKGHTHGSSRGTTSGTSDPRGFLTRGTPTESRGSSESWSDSYSDSRSWSVGESTSDVARSLRTPDEVRRLGDSDQYLIFRGMHPVQCWRPPYWNVFPSLPEFTLGDILDTVGREPVDETERDKFTGWRRLPLTMKPDELPQRSADVPALPAPVTPQLAPWTRIALIGGLIALAWFGWFAWSAYSERTERLARETAAQERAQAEAAREKARLDRIRAEAMSLFDRTAARTAGDAASLVDRVWARIAAQQPPEENLSYEFALGLRQVIHEESEKAKGKIKPMTAIQQAPLNRALFGAYMDLIRSANTEMLNVRIAAEKRASDVILSEIKPRAVELTLSAWGAFRKRADDARGRIASVGVSDAPALARQLATELQNEMDRAADAAISQLATGHLSGRRAKISAALEEATRAQIPVYAKRASETFERILRDHP